MAAAYYRAIGAAEFVTGDATVHLARVSNGVFRVVATQHPPERSELIDVTFTNMPGLLETYRHRLDPTPNQLTYVANRLALTEAAADWHILRVGGLQSRGRAKVERRKMGAVYRVDADRISIDSWDLGRVELKLRQPIYRDPDTHAIDEDDISYFLGAGFVVRTAVGWSVYLDNGTLDRDFLAPSGRIWVTLPEIFHDQLTVIDATPPPSVHLDRLDLRSGKVVEIPVDASGLPIFEPERAR